ncbi:MAG: hypothetical protein MJE68_11975 [Proteobacteria bacterium]|nr:hypothetical protein [Pseudomonadota bacterium]
MPCPTDRGWHSIEVVSVQTLEEHPLTVYHYQSSYECVGVGRGGVEMKDDDLINEWDLWWGIKDAIIIIVF